MSLERYIQQTAARVRVTIPIEWGSSRKVAYIGFERDVGGEAIADDDRMKFEANRLIDLIQEVATRRAPVPTAPPLKKSYCSICDKNGFPMTEIVWPKPFAPGNKPLNPDGSHHEHKVK